MSYPPYDSYLSNLDSLVFDSPSEVIQSEKDVADELDLWVRLSSKEKKFFFSSSVTSRINNQYPILE